MARVNIFKRIKTDGKWRLVSIPRTKKGGYNWKALPEGRYYIEWYEQGKRKRQAAGSTTAQAQEAARRKRHELEGKALGLKHYLQADEADKTPLHVAARKYLENVATLKKPNTHRKYENVLERFLDFLPHRKTAAAITREDLEEYMRHLKKNHGLGNNSVIHHMIITAQFLKKQGRPGLTSKLDMPTKITTLPQEYTDHELRQFFKACNAWEYALYQTFLLTGIRQQEAIHLAWEDIDFHNHTLHVTAKPEIGFYPKTWEERTIPIKKTLAKRLNQHPKKNGSKLVFPSPTGNKELHMWDKCKAIAKRSGQDPKRFNLRKFRSTYATKMLRAGFDVRTVQAWMGHKSLETTMRYLSPRQDVHQQLDQLQGILQEI